MDCKQAMDLITAYLLRREVDRTELSRGYRHLSECETCQREFEATISILQGKEFHLHEALAQERQRRQGCAGCWESLAVCAEMSEEEIKRQRSKFLAHLEACPDCRQDYDFLRELVKEEREGGFGPVPSGPSFKDLAGAAATAPAPFWESGGKGLRRLAADLKILVGRGAAWLAEIPEWLVPWQSTLVPAYSRLTRGEDAAPAVAPPGEQELILTDGENNLKIVMRIRAGLPNRVDILVIVLDFLNDTPQSGASITLYDQHGNFLEHSVTVSELNSIVIFKNLELEQYYIKIEYQEGTWEIPLLLLPIK